MIVLLYHSLSCSGARHPSSSIYCAAHAVVRPSAQLRQVVHASLAPCIDDPVSGALPHQAPFSLARPAKLVALVQLLAGRQRQPPALALRRNLLLLRLSGLRRVEIDSSRAYARTRPLANA